MTQINRRHLLAGATGAATLAIPGFARARATNRRLLVINLRGGLDGLAAVPPIGDPDYVRVRGRLALPASGDGAALRLDATFALHKNLPRMHALYRAGELLPIHACATPYRGRSHVDAQHVLDTGGASFANTGASTETWLNKALGAPPLHMRGAAPVSATATAAARLLSDEHGPLAAMMEVGGWDTHADQGLDLGPLARNLAALDAGLDTFKREIGPAWTDTVVVIATEFGRAAMPNAAGGADHGTGAAAFLAGGAVNGGRVLADWPGLSRGALHEARDLRPTTDLRAVLKGVLGDHLRVPAAVLHRDVFPDSAALHPLQDLLRA